MKMKVFTGKTIVYVLFFLMALQACASPAASVKNEGVAQPVVQLPAVENEETEVPVIRKDVVPVILPKEINGHAADQVSMQGGVITGGDRFTFGQFERPFNSEKMDIYYPALDIVDVLVYQDDAWIYGIIQLNDRESDVSSAAKYALELDTDRDGRGDWLVIASNPTSADWTVSGVQVFYDENDDVGNVSAMFTDAGAFGDGFEKLIIDQGVGEDPESAWARISPENPNVIQISIKRSLLGKPNSFMISMWAGHSLLDPALFDLNDLYTHDEAGAANPGFELFYPIKAVSEIDNSCRLAVGFHPTGNEPGVCKTLAIQKQSDPSVPSSPYSTETPSCGPCPKESVGQNPYPDCTCLFQIN